MVTGGEISEGGYIQGAGDDTENWAHGLSAALFWAHHVSLLATSEIQLPGLIEMLVHNAVDMAPIGQRLRLVKPTKTLFITSIASIGTEITPNGACIIVLLPKVTEESTWRTSPTQLNLGLGHHKLGSRNLRSALPTIMAFTEQILRLVKGSNGLKDNHIILACESGKDLSVGVALALLCLFFDEGGNFVSKESESAKIDKAFIRRRLGWISISIPEANPSRATLQSVNSFLMERP